MVLAAVNKSKQLLLVTFVGQVRAEEVAKGREDVAALLAELAPGFRLLADLGRLESMGVNCAAEIGKVMDLCDQRGVGFVVRVIPDPTKDIGLGILSHFHYHNHPRTAHCANMVEAAKLLSL
jgi:anti-anti-sigma regulatory factor